MARRTTATLCRLNKHIIATAVQDATTLAVLWQRGITFAQGHYIQEPNRHLTYEFSNVDK
ncbi:MAG: EAL domain-containing protein [Chromatiales bacterium]|nr:EAL domain-containing protein [Chromatiales bacterium]